MLLLSKCLFLYIQDTIALIYIWFYFSFIELSSEITINITANFS